MRVAIGRDRRQAWVPPIDYASPGNFGGVSLDDRDGPERVEVITLDSLGLDRCDFMKIDVEGMEDDVIAGAATTIRRHKPIIYVENDRRERSPALIARIERLGYACYWHLPGYFSPDNIYRNPLNVFGGMVSVNMLCVPRGRDPGVIGLEPVTDAARHPIDDFKKA
jgi:hypothetical protein